MNKKEKSDFAEAIKIIAAKYDKLFNTEFPYSAGIRQVSIDGKEYAKWYFHMHFYPPLLRSVTIKKFMVGYELLANPQRNITAEQSAKMLRGL